MHDQLDHCPALSLALKAFTSRYLRRGIHERQDSGRRIEACKICSVVLVESSQLANQVDLAFSRIALTSTPCRSASLHRWDLGFLAKTGGHNDVLTGGNAVDVER